MYDEIVAGLSKRVPEKKASGFTFVQADGKRKYTALMNEGKKTSYFTEIQVEQLDADFFDSDSLCYHAGESDITKASIDYLTDYVLDDFFHQDDSYITFSNGRVKLNFFKTRDFEIDKYITIDESKGFANVSGIIVDFETRPEFIEACNEGIICDMPNCVDYYKATAGKEDAEISDIVEEYGEDVFRNEIQDLMAKTIDKVAAGAEVVPRGFYFIKDNKMYYITAEEYYRIYEDACGYNNSRLFRLIRTPGFDQLNSGLIKNQKQAVNTIGAVGNELHSLSERNCLDLTTIGEFGITPQDFIPRILSNDPQVFELLEKTLKKQAEVPKK